MLQGALRLILGEGFLSIIIRLRICNLVILMIILITIRFIETGFIVYLNGASEEQLALFRSFSLFLLGFRLIVFAVKFLLKYAAI